MSFTSIGKLTYPFLFLVFSLFATPPVFGDGEEAEDRNSNANQWEFDVGGQVRLKGDFAENQNFTDFSFSPGHSEVQFLGAFLKYRSKSTGFFNQKY